VIVSAVVQVDILHAGHGAVADRDVEQAVFAHAALGRAADERPTGHDQCWHGEDVAVGVVVHADRGKVEAKAVIALSVRGRDLARGGGALGHVDGEAKGEHGRGDRGCVGGARGCGGLALQLAVRKVAFAHERGQFSACGVAGTTAGGACL